MKHFIFVAILCLVSCAFKEKSNVVGHAPDNGYVKFLMDVDVNGLPINYKIIESHPKGKFDSKALEMIKEWKFKPKHIDGVAVVQHELKYTMEFNAVEG